MLSTRSLRATLTRGQVLALDGARRVWIRPGKGPVWVTSGDGSGDVVIPCCTTRGLEPRMTLVVQALGEANVEVRWSDRRRGTHVLPPLFPRFRVGLQPKSREGRLTSQCAAGQGSRAGSLSQRVWRVICGWVWLQRSARFLAAYREGAARRRILLYVGEARLQELRARALRFAATISHRTEVESHQGRVGGPQQTDRPSLPPTPGLFQKSVPATGELGETEGCGE